MGLIIDVYNLKEKRIKRMKMKKAGILWDGGMEGGEGVK